MSIFLLQSIFLLLLCFVVGYLIARFIKRKLYNRSVRKTASSVGDTEGRAQPVSTATQAIGTGNEAEFYTSIKPDNLQIIEGIGPKMESVLNENGISTWSQLATKTVPELQAILGKYGNRYQIIDPTIWLEQVKLAAAGKVDDLINLQKIDGVSKLENMMYQGRKSGFAKYKQDDLKIVEGIGPKIEVLLGNAGIDTWQQLSVAELSSIKAILQAAGPRYRLATPESWSLQARLANNGDWSKLKQIQDKLRYVRPKQVESETAEA
jgi:predicted flap endonuclease-1-like 5' DNA nuclease